MEIEATHEKIDAMYEATQVAKKELRDFQPMVQDAYV
jgi:hypothetical protein